MGQLSSMGWRDDGKLPVMFRWSLSTVTTDSTETWEISPPFGVSILALLSTAVLEYSAELSPPLCRSLSIILSCGGSSTLQTSGKVGGVVVINLRRQPWPRPLTSLHDCIWSHSPVRYCPSKPVRGGENTFDWLPKKKKNIPHRRTGHLGHLGKLHTQSFSRFMKQFNYSHQAQNQVDLVQYVSLYWSLNWAKIKPTRWQYTLKTYFVAHKFSL